MKKQISMKLIHFSHFWNAEDSTINCLKVSTWVTRLGILNCLDNIPSHQTIATSVAISFATKFFLGEFQAALREYILNKMESQLN